MTHRGEPASIWQLPELRRALAPGRFWTVAGHQCQFPGVDRKKPTRLLSDVEGITDFGLGGWPSFDAAGYYTGPLPHSCGHVHRSLMIGRNRKGGFHTSPTAAYPPGMCKFLATRIFKHWRKHLMPHPPFGDGRTPKLRVRPPRLAEEKERKVVVKEAETGTTPPWR